VSDSATEALDQIVAERKPTDVERILALPQKDLTKAAPDLTKRFKRPNGKMSLRQVQSEVLYWSHVCKGLLALVGVGEGKTLATFLLPWVFKSKRPLLLIPAAMRAQCFHDWKTYNRHFYLPDTLSLHSYSELSTNTSLLTALRPDLIICDEAHKLRNLDASRTRRMMRYMKKHNPAFVALSGTLTSTSILDFAHLAVWALGEKAPVPITRTYLTSWAEVLDRDGKPTKGDKLSMKTLIRDFGDGTDDARAAFKSRLVSTRGVVTTNNEGPKSNLLIHSRVLSASPAISGAVSDMKRLWTTPAGGELSSPLEFGQVMRQLVCGFYYVWKWPNDIPDVPWLEARARWNRAVRRFLSRNPPEGYDSPALLANACIRLLQGQAERLPKYLVNAFKQWLPERKKTPPPTAARWLCNSFLEDVIAWAKKQKDPPIIWYGHRAVAYRLSRMTGWPVFADGPEAAQALLRLKRPTPALLSIAAHSTGKNLQLFGNQILAHPVSSGSQMEQLLGRCHRTGQRRDEVNLTYYVDEDTKVFRNAMLLARKSAKYIEETTDMPQRLIYADWTDETDAAWTMEDSQKAESDERERTKIPEQS